jgi:glyoxylase-like metal-dependent hydrolase (beta-lactamase superfamily II)
MTDLPVRRIEIPTPYAVGPVNCYLIEADPVTLVDAGINTPEGHNALLLGLASAGYSPHSIERILVTHAHPDHYGLVHVVQEASEAAVYFPEREIARVRDRQLLFEVGRLLSEAGVPLELLFKMDQQRSNDRTRPAMDHDKVVPVGDGDRFEFGNFVLEAHLMPGHTGGHVVYHEPESGALFAGDQLLPDVSPNPLLEPSLDEPGERRRSLKEYLRSLDQMAAMNLRVVYPGHGDPVGDPQALIARTVRHHARRKRTVADNLGPDPRTPYEIAMALYPKVTGYDVFLAVSEIVAHLDLVVDDGDAVISERDGVTYYAAAPHA